MKIYMDDVRPAPEGWLLARSVEEAKESILRGRYWMPYHPLEVSLDFDMGMTGAHCETCNDRGFGRLHDFEHPDYCPDCTHEILENDLSAPTGIELLFWMTENEILPDKIYIHSANPVGRNAMQWVVKDMQKQFKREWPEAFR